MRQLYLSELYPQLWDIACAVGKSHLEMVVVFANDIDQYYNYLDKQQQQQQQLDKQPQQQQGYGCIDNEHHMPYDDDYIDNGDGDGDCDGEGVSVSVSVSVRQNQRQRTKKRNEILQ